MVEKRSAAAAGIEAAAQIGALNARLNVQVVVIAERDGMAAIGVFVLPAEAPPVT